jgi:hypothetical protein
VSLSRNVVQARQSATPIMSRNLSRFKPILSRFRLRPIRLRLLKIKPTKQPVGHLLLAVA